MDFRQKSVKNLGMTKIAFYDVLMVEKEMHTVRKLLIIAKADPVAAEAAATIRKWLRERKVTSFLFNADADTSLLCAKASLCDAILILGGDGTMIGLARKLWRTGIPLAGMNFGRVGFLNELPKSGWESSLSNLIQGKWQIERHMALCWKVLKQTGSVFETTAEGIAVNDVVTAHGIVARTVSLEVQIDDVLFSTLCGDGIIIGTPLGSTAYTASAGGPLAMPSLSAMLITPVCPFSGGFSPLVLPVTSQIRLKACRPNSDVVISIDGQEDHKLAFGDVLEVCGMADGLHMLVSEGNWYLKRLISRGIISPGPGIL